MDKKVIWGQKVGSQGLPNPGTVLSFQPTATNSDQILIFLLFRSLASNLCIKKCFEPKKLDPKGYQTLDLSLVSNQQQPTANKFDFFKNFLYSGK